MAKLVGSWSKDPSSKVGAVTVKDNRLLSQGWNGFPRGIPDDPKILKVRERKYELTVHAEQNAIYNAGYNGVSLNGATLYVHGLPVCSDCAKGIIQTGITRIVMRVKADMGDKWRDSFESSQLLFDKVGIEHSWRVYD